VRDINRFYQEQPSLYQKDFDPTGFRWIESNDAEQSVFSYIRFAENPADFLVVVCNFTPIPRYQYRIGVPQMGHYAEVMNSDSAHYGGGNIGNLGGVEAERILWHAWPQSVSVTVPPLGVIVFRYGSENEQGRAPN
jgi:1,4-alpha-glucan branching enzyme